MCSRSLVLDTSGNRMPKDGWYHEYLAYVEQLDPVLSPCSVLAHYIRGCLGISIKSLSSRPSAPDLPYPAYLKPVQGSALVSATSPVLAFSHAIYIGSSILGSNIR